MLILQRTEDVGKMEEVTMPSTQKAWFVGKVGNDGVVGSYVRLLHLTVTRVIGATLVLNSVPLVPSTTHIKV